MSEPWPPKALWKPPPPPDRRERLGQSLRKAFPIPKSGSFEDLLEAIDLAEDKTQR